MMPKRPFLEHHYRNLPGRVGQRPVHMPHSIAEQPFARSRRRGAGTWTAGLYAAQPADFRRLCCAAVIAARIDRLSRRLRTSTG
ncbi:MAG: hypothetical protein ACUVQK_11255 [Thermogutta sp.]